jgi:lipoprotein-releasing system ATP-binding protein
MGWFGIDEVARRPFAILSGGEAQRLMLARTLAAAPDLMLVDERAGVC